MELKHWIGEQPREIRQTCIKERLVPKDGALDYLIFDCAPGWDVLSVNILMAADEVLCPVALQAPSMEGLKTFFGYLMSAQRLNQGLELRYILPTLFDRRTRQSFDIYRQLKRLFHKQLCEPIRYNVRLSEAPAVGKSIFEYRKNATGAIDYARLIRRILNDDGRKKDVPDLFEDNPIDPMGTATGARQPPSSVHEAMTHRNGPEKKKPGFTCPST